MKGFFRSVLFILGISKPVIAPGTVDLSDALAHSVAFSDALAYGVSVGDALVGSITITEGQP